tara:strand:- start:7471 stop:7815 length:345 start_codon:yes stop_codon:yes gene_type:complete
MARYPVPKSIQDIAERALKQNLELPISQRAAYKDDKGKRVAGTGMRTARRLMSGSVDEDQIILMSAWFARHGKSPKEAQARRDKTSKASIAWRLWGSNAGRSWANQMKKKFDRD